MAAYKREKTQGPTSKTQKNLIPTKKKQRNRVPVTTMAAYKILFLHGKGENGFSPLFIIALTHTHTLPPLVS